MRTIYRISARIIALALILHSCSKEDEFVPGALVTILKGTVEDTAPATKTQHEYSDKTLKVSWKSGDQIAVSDGNNLYKFTQTGDIGDGGHTAMFATENPVNFGEGEIIAVYPYTADLSYDLTSQEGTIDKLFQTDLLLARAQVSASKVEDLEFNPFCAVIRLPKDILVTDEDYTGEMKITVSGTNLGGTVTVSKTGGIDVQESGITVPVSIAKGKFAEDAYIVFVPREKTGLFCYSLETDRNDAYSFNIENISTSKVYSVKTIFDGIVVFEDKNFKKYCLENFDLDADGEISFAEARKVKKMSFNTDEEHWNISSLKGVEAFKNLSYLDCRGFSATVSGRGKLTSLDVSSNTKLDTLFCSKNQLTSLVVGNNPSLTKLYCDFNQLESLDLSNSPALIYLDCNDNRLKSLILGNKPALFWLDCWNNQLMSLDVSECPALFSLNCSNNQLESLDLSKCYSLAYFTCNSNQIISLDFSESPALQTLHCQNNQLKSLNVSKNYALSTLVCNDNQLTTLDVSKNPKLSYLDCSSNKLTNLKFEIITSEGEVHCTNNQLTSLDVSKSSSLRELYCDSNQLKHLDVSKNIALGTLVCNDNQLTSLDFSIYLAKLSCSNNQLTSLDISGCKLYLLNCSNNPLKSLDLSKISTLVELYCNNNQLTSLDLNKNSSIQYLSCSNNQLTSLDVSVCEWLYNMDCSANQLTSLDLSNNSHLAFLYCADNQLTSLDVSACAWLHDLDCRANHITSLDVSNNELFFRSLTAWTTSNSADIFKDLDGPKQITVNSNTPSFSFEVYCTKDNRNYYLWQPGDGDIVEWFKGRFLEIIVKDS